MRARKSAAADPGSPTSASPSTLMSPMSPAMTTAFHVSGGAEGWDARAIPGMAANTGATSSAVFAGKIPRSRRNRTLTKSGRKATAAAIREVEGLPDVWPPPRPPTSSSAAADAEEEEAEEDAA